MSHSDVPMQLSSQPSEVDTALFSIVGVGASAGGLEALSEFLKVLPPDTGMAFVLVQHLSPTHASTLVEILSRVTKMPVMEVTGEPTVKPNHVYVIPPGQDMVISEGKLHLSPREGRGAPRQIDRFLRALAEELKHRAIGVILSGTANDGTNGLGAIKAEGGITFAQDDTAQQDGMPRSAIASGCVDFVLSPGNIAREIVRIGKLGGELPKSDRSTMSRILELLRQGMGVDFTNYKQNTLSRRIARRMVLHRIDSLREYADFLERNPSDVRALYYDILIDVTSFFRNPEAFEALKAKVFPRLLKNRSPHDPVRMWTLGCSTGEETYSLAIAFIEYCESIGNPTPVQLFATDLNDRGIETARAAMYDLDIAREVSPGRLQKFFVEVDGGVRINKSIRDLCIFSRHNILSDPPFSRIDLISCRNLLIYLEPILQQKVLQVLHYALKSDGFLWLGGSETVGGFHNLFTLEDAKCKIYVAEPTDRVVPVVPRREAMRPNSSYVAERQIDTGPKLHREAEHLLVSRYAPPSVVVSRDLDVLHYLGDTSSFLSPAPGKASLSILKMLREGLLVDVRSALIRAGKDRAPVRYDGLRVRTSGGTRQLAVEVIPLKTGEGGDKSREGGGFLVIFDEAPPVEGVPVSDREKSVVLPPSGAPDSEIARLQQELIATRDYLQSVIEQYETANEQLQSSNEEAQSGNEELQSINEELETSKEEIQSSNEELATVNDELNNRNAELSRVNSDLVNILASVQIVIVTLGPDLRVRRFTPMAEKLFSLVASDVGRPINAIKLNFDLPDLEALLLQVLDTASVQEREVSDRQGRWYSLRLSPYKPNENRIDGAVLVMVDITRQKRAHEYMQRIVETVREPLVVLDDELRVRTTNRSFYKMFQVTPEETEGRNLYELGSGQWDIPELRVLLEEVLVEGTQFSNFEVRQEFPQIGKMTMQLNARRLPQDGDAKASILLAIEDITSRKLTEEERQKLLENEQQARREADSANDAKESFIATLSHELRTPLNAVLGWVQLLQRGVISAEETPKALDVIERAAKHQAQLISDLLDISRISAGKMGLEMQPLNLSKVVDETIEGARRLAEQKKVVLRKNLDDDIGLMVGDQTRLQQVIWNLLSNAIKFTPENGTVTVLLERTPLRAELTVRDTGEGIEAALIPHLFERFWQADSVRKSGGVGLGLAITKEIVELHGGTIWAKSPGPGQGATFIVSLPLSPRQDSSEEKLDRAAGTDLNSTWADLAGVKILLVEDDPENRSLAKRVFEACGAIVSTAVSSSDGIASFTKSVPDVLVSDIAMPGEDGYNFLRRVRSLSSRNGGKVPAIALTAFARSEDRTRALLAGFQAHVAKPFESVELVATVASLLGRTGGATSSQAI